MVPLHQFILLVQASFEDIHCVPKNAHIFIFWITPSKNEPILIIFGILNPEGTWHWKVISLPTSPTYCSYCTWGMSKKLFLLAGLFIRAACWDVGWTVAERRGWGHWPMAETTGSVCPCTGWSFWTLSVALLPFMLPHSSFQSHPLSSRNTMCFRTHELLYFSQGIA